MNRKQLTLLIVLAVVVGGAGWYVYSKKQSSYERGTDASADGNKLLKGVPASAINDVAQFTIRQNTNEVNLARSAEGWTVKERGGYPANFETISEMLKKLWDLKITRNVEVGPSRLPALKLTKTDGTLLDLKDDKGKSVVSLTLGLPATKDSGNNDPQMGGGSFPSGRYVMRGEDVKTVALVGDALSNLEPKPEEWLNKTWFKIEKIKAITVVGKEATNSWKLTRESETGDWKLADAKAGESVDSAKASGLNWLLSSPSFNDVIVNSTPEKTGLTNATAATLETFDGFTYTIKLGKTEEENHAFQITVAAIFPKERAPGKDEKKEDKEKLDKEFA
ncbi:MAG TPA: DUF4340 domain-containing protein, partial [Candidatus Acidoferrum sp.]|nr:DUF4340 domain-containing protein [Candidatus Acidoferrum sp.]